MTTIDGKLDWMNPHIEIPKGWAPIKDAPEGDEEFLVGAWVGEKIWNEDHSGFVWVGKPKFIQALSHNENPSGPHITRGWNHRNGPLGDVKATLWHPLPDAPELADVFVDKLNSG